MAVNQNQQASTESITKKASIIGYLSFMVYYLTKKVEVGIDYSQRGWTFFERSCAEMIKGSNAFEGYSFEVKWQMCTNIGEDGAAARSPPIAPEKFAQELSLKKFTTKADKASVVELYTRTSLAMLRGLKLMDLSGLPIQLMQPAPFFMDSMCRYFDTHGCRANEYAYISNYIFLTNIDVG